MRLRLKYFVLLAVTAFSFGCDKDDDTQPTTGTVKGSISPANGGSQVFLITGSDTLKATPASTGTYEFTQVKAGSYQATVKTNAGYSAPAATAITVTAGQTTDVPVITLTQVPANGAASVVIDGVTFSGTPSFAGFGTGKLFYLSNGFQVHITLPANITGPGTFTTSASSDLVFMVLNNSTGATWSSDDAGGSGTLTVTSFDAATKKGNATFSFTATPSMGATGNKVGTNGSLQNVRLKN